MLRSILFALLFLFCSITFAQREIITFIDTDSIAEIDSVYSFTGGLAYNEKGKSSLIDEAFVYFHRNEGDSLYFTIFQDFNAAFKKNDLVDFLIVSDFYYNSDMIYTIFGFNQTDKKDSTEYKFTFFFQRGQLIIEDSKSDVIKYVLTGQYIPHIREWSDRMNQVDKVRDRRRKRKR